MCQGHARGRPGQTGIDTTPIQSLLAAMKPPVPFPSFVLLAALGSGCSESREQEFATMKQQVSASQLQTWAATMLTNYPGGANCRLCFPGIARGNDIILSN